MGIIFGVYGNSRFEIGDLGDILVKVVKSISAFHNLCRELSRVVMLSGLMGHDVSCVLPVRSDNKMDQVCIQCIVKYGW